MIGLPQPGMAHGGLAQSIAIGEAVSRKSGKDRQDRPFIHEKAPVAAAAAEFPLPRHAAMFDISALMMLWLFAQNGGAGGGNGAGGGGGVFDFWAFAPLLVIGVLFYLMLIRPERRKRREMQELLDSLKENDRVVTIGGIVGSIVSFSKSGDEVVLRIDEKNNTKVRVLRSAISRPLKVDEEAGGEKKELGKDV